MSSPPLILSIGELLWDEFPKMKQPGGAPAICAYHAAKMGVNSYLISAVGNDDVGRDLITRLKRTKINLVVAISDFPTGKAIVSVDKKSTNYHIPEKMAWDTIAITNIMCNLAMNADAIYFGTLAQRSSKSRETIQTLLKLAPSKVLKILDLNLRQNFYNKKIIEESLHLCNVLKVSVSELSILKEMFSIDIDDVLKVFEWLQQKFNLQYILYNTSSTGYSIVYLSQTYSFIRNPEIKISNTIGMGSTFVGSFITSILSGKKPIQAHELAVIQAAHVCKKHSAWV